MDYNIKTEETSFDFGKGLSNEIKIIGVGDGGSNVVNYMFNQSIKTLDMIVCNSKMHSLQDSPVPHKIPLKVNFRKTTDLGNGNIKYQFSLGNTDDFDKVLDERTKMVFVIAAMDSDIVNIAASEISRIAKEKGIITVVIAIIPFEVEDAKRRDLAFSDIEKLRNQPDSIIVFDSDNLTSKHRYSDSKSGFLKMEELITVWIKDISGFRTDSFTINVDFRDLKTVLTDSGYASVGFGLASGENRAKIAAASALNNQMLYWNNITGAKNILLVIACGKTEINIDEIGEINDYIQSKAGYTADIIMSVEENPGLQDVISVSILATGFDIA